MECGPGEEVQVDFGQGAFIVGQRRQAASASRFSHGAEPFAQRVQRGGSTANDRCLLDVPGECVLALRRGAQADRARQSQGGGAACGLVRSGVASEDAGVCGALRLRVSADQASDAEAQREGGAWRRLRPGERAEGPHVYEFARSERTPNALGSGGCRRAGAWHDAPAAGPAFPGGREGGVVAVAERTVGELSASRSGGCIGTDMSRSTRRITRCRRSMSAKRCGRVGTAAWCVSSTNDSCRSRCTRSSCRGNSARTSNTSSPRRSTRSSMAPSICWSRCGVWASVARVGPRRCCKVAVSPACGCCRVCCTWPASTRVRLWKKRAAAAHAHGEYRLRTVRALLKRQDVTQPLFEFMDEHPLIRPLSDYGQFVREALREGGSS